MSDLMQRAFAVALVRADENVALGNALAAAERTIADLRRQLAATTNAYHHTLGELDRVMVGYDQVIAEMSEELETIRARLDAMM